MRHSLFFATLLLVGSGLMAGTFTYNSTLSNWTGVGYTPTSTYDFESASTGGSATSFMTLGGYSFNAPSNALIINTNAPTWVGTGKYLLTYGNGYTLTIPNTGIFALGFNLGCAFCGGTAATSITATDKDGATYTVNSVPTTTNAPSAFWGISSTSALTTIQFNFGTSYFGIDNIISGGQAPQAPANTPESASLILIGTGLAIMARYRRYLNLNATPA